MNFLKKNKWGIILVLLMVFLLPQPQEVSAATGSISIPPILMCDLNGLGTAEITATADVGYQIRVGSAGGALYATEGAGVLHISNTGYWVTDGTVFYLVETSSGATIDTETANIDNTSPFCDDRPKLEVNGGLFSMPVSEGETFIVGTTYYIEGQGYTSSLTNDFTITNNATIDNLNSVLNWTANFSGHCSGSQNGSLQKGQSTSVNFSWVTPNDSTDLSCGISITSNAAAPSSINFWYSIPVTYASLTALPSPMSFGATEGAAIPSSQTLYLNGYFGIPFISDNVAWLTVNSVSCPITSSNEKNSIFSYLTKFTNRAYAGLISPPKEECYSVSVNTTSFSVGTYSAQIRISNWAGGNGENDRVVNVFYTISSGAGVPTVNLTANPTSVSSGDSSNLSWFTTDATSCTASGDWSGVKAPSGSEPTGALVSNKSYTLTCTGPGPGSGVDSAIVTVAGIVGSCSLSSGYIQRDYWLGIVGDPVINLTSNVNYPDSPSGSTQPPSFEAPSDWDDSYGTRMYGLVEAPETGSYTFYISSDNASELWIADSDIPTDNFRRIAYESSYSGSRVWQTGSEKSGPINLTAGQKYYIEAIHKEGGGGDNLAVGWVVPSGGPITVIPGSCLSPELSSDLTAGNSSPSTATVDTGQIFSATISNIGDVSTGIGFSNFFQVAANADGGGVITDLVATAMPALVAGTNNAATSPTHTFTSTGIYSVRACADKTSSIDTGVITESNENNNCGSNWTNVNVISAPVATVSIDADDIDLPYINNGTTLNWSYLDASSCTITPPATISVYPEGGGSVSIGSLLTSRTYTISCDPGPQVDSVTVNVATPASYILDVIKSEQGTIASVPSGISCGETCQNNYDEGTSVTLTATPNTGRIFIGWGGDCFGKGQCVLTIDSPKTVYANFIADPNYREF